MNQSQEETQKRPSEVRSWRPSLRSIRRVTHLTLGSDLRRDLYSEGLINQRISGHQAKKGVMGHLI